MLSVEGESATCHCTCERVFVPFRVTGSDGETDWMMWIGVRFVSDQDLWETGMVTCSLKVEAVRIWAPGLAKLPELQVTKP